MYAQVIVVASVLASCLAGYPKSLVMYRDPANYDSAVKNSKGPYTEYVGFNGRYEIDSLVVGSLVYDWDDFVDPKPDGVELYLAQNYGENYTRIGFGKFEGHTNPGEAIVVEMKPLKGDQIIVEYGKDYFVEVDYKRAGYYPYYGYRRVISFGPLSGKTASSGFVIGVGYSNAD